MNDEQASGKLAIGGEVKLLHNCDTIPVKIHPDGPGPKI